MAGQDYGPKGCCGPSAFAMFLGIVGLLTWGVVALVGALS